MTDVYEGSLIRVFRRLEELLRQMAQAAKVIGSEDLEKKFEDSLTKVKRGRPVASPFHFKDANVRYQILSLLRRCIYSTYQYYELMCTRY